MHVSRVVVSAFCSLAVIALVCTGCTAVAQPSSSPHPKAKAVGPEIVFQYDGKVQTARIGDKSGTPIADGIDPGEQDHPRWSPDGSEIVFSVNESDGTEDIWLHDVKKKTTKKIFDCAAPCFWSDDPAFSPDGSRVAFEQVAQAAGQTGRDGTPYLMSMKPDGSEVKVVATAAPIDAFYVPSWSPDATHIAVEWGTFATASADDSNQLTGQIAVVDVASGAITILDTGTGVAGNPSWSPDGSRIAFQRSDATTDFELYSIAPTGGPVNRITHQTDNGGRSLQPSWANDGSSIAAVWEATPGAQHSKAALVDPVTGKARVVSTFGATHISVRP